MEIQLDMHLDRGLSLVRLCEIVLWAVGASLCTWANLGWLWIFHKSFTCSLVGTWQPTVKEKRPYLDRASITCISKWDYFSISLACCPWLMEDGITKDNRIWLEFCASITILQILFLFFIRKLTLEMLSQIHREIAQKKANK